jgi:hypothetical protein
MILDSPGVLDKVAPRASEVAEQPSVSDPYKASRREKEPAELIVGSVLRQRSAGTTMARARDCTVHRPVETLLPSCSAQPILTAIVGFTCIYSS